MKLTNQIIIIIILSIAIVLRFFNFSEIPFTHDEFSALFRLKFDSFSELIDKGVKIDGHPAGIQIFLYYWTKLFGYQEWVVKLPFALFGVFSVFLIYLVGKKWFNETVGLLSAAFIASIQFSVMYSQIARPYMSGMFFTLLMVYYWSNLILNPHKAFYKNGLLFIFTASLCAYNHYFSLLFAAIVGISGVFFIKREFLVKYLLSGLLIFILYIPHLQIFFYQLSIGGVEGWLGKPHNEFIFEFIYYIFNNSIFVISLTLAIIIFGLFFQRKDDLNVKLIVLSFAWFIIPFLIGFFYSRYVNAVLQYSVLIFSFPFIFFVLFGFIKEQNTKINLILVSIILITNILTLVYGRKHYNMFYKSIYKQILIDYKNLRKVNNNTVYIIDSHNKITDYYIPKLNIDRGYINYSNTFKNLKEVKYFLETTVDTTDKLFLGCISSVAPNLVPLIQDYFPNIEIQNNYFAGTSFLFSKQNYASNKTISCLNFDSVFVKNWNSIDTTNLVSIDSSISDKAYLFDNNIEWGPTFSVALQSIMKNKNNFIDISVKVHSKENLDDVILVGSLESKENNIYWSETEFNEFILPKQETSQWFIVHHSLKLSDIYLNYDDLFVKIYIWNRGKKSFIIDDFKVSLREGNPIIYGLD